MPGLLQSCSSFGKHPPHWCPNGDAQQTFKLTWNLHCTSIISPLYLYKLVPKIIYSPSQGPQSLHSDCQSLWPQVFPRGPWPCETYMTTAIRAPDLSSPKHVYIVMLQLIPHLYLEIYQSMYKYVNLSTCQSIYDNISIYKSINQYINLTINLCINISTYQPVNLYSMKIYQSINRSINISI